MDELPIAEPMRLSALICDRYKAFKERQRVELAPITLIIGKNGSGKSIFSRLPLILAAGISENANGPLDLSAGGVDHAMSFQDLVNARSALPFSLGAEIANSRVKLQFLTTLRYISEIRALSIEGFELRQDGVVIFSASLANADQLTKARQLFKIVHHGVPREVSLNFVGLFPDTRDMGEGISSSLQSLLQQFRQALPSPSYLGPFRVEPGTSLRSPAQNIRELGTKGERALEILADDRLRQDGLLARQVSEWFRNAMGQEVNIDVTGEQPQVRVGEPDSAFQGNLSDTGAGFSQCLPYVVQHFAFKADRLKSPILIVEQPELHLHPAAHGDLADLAITSALKRDEPRVVCIVETHSEEFIMRIRRRIAEGLPAETAQILSINHVEINDSQPSSIPVKTIAFDNRGNPDAWPTGVFAEALADLAAMRQVTRNIV